MRIGKYCIYLGKEYSVGKTDKDYVNLLSSDINDIEYGFTLRDKKKPLLSKRVLKSGLERYYKVYAFGLVNGHKIQIIGVKSDMVLLCTSDPNVAEDCSMELVGIREYKKFFNIDKLKIIEEEVDY